MAKFVSKNPRRPSADGSNIRAQFASRSLKAALSTLPEVINIYQFGDGLYLDKIVQFQH